MEAYSGSRKRDSRDCRIRTRKDDCVAGRRLGGVASYTWIAYNIPDSLLAREA